MVYDSVIIGSGASGLTAALVLAQNGQKVALVEKSSHMAPLLRRFKRGNIWCDPGFHYSGGLNPLGTLSVLFRYLKMSDRIQPIPMKKEAYDILCFGDKEVILPSGINDVRRSLCDSFPKSTGAVNSYIDKIISLMDRAPFFNFKGKLEDFDEVAKSELTSSSLTDTMKNIGAEEGLIELLSQYGEFLYGTPGEEVPFGVHALVMGSFYNSSSTLPHGGDDIVDAFDYRLQQEGVDFFPDSPVEGLIVNKTRRFQGVKLSGGREIEAKYCVSTIHPELLINVLTDMVRPAYISRLKSLESSYATFGVYFELDEVPEKIAHTNLYKLSPGEKKINENQFIGVMACGPENYDNRKKGLCVLRGSKKVPVSKELYLANRKTKSYIEYKKREIQKTTKELTCFFPEIEGKLKVVDTVTPLTYERYTGTPGGSLYGVKQSVNQIKLSSKTSIHQFYLAGQSILMPGVMGAAISGFLGAANILGRENLWEDLKKCY